MIKPLNTMWNINHKDYITLQINERLISLSTIQRVVRFTKSANLWLPRSEAEFKEFEPRLKFNPLLKLVPLKIVINVSRFKSALN